MIDNIAKNTLILNQNQKQLLKNNLQNFLNLEEITNFYEIFSIDEKNLSLEDILGNNNISHSLLYLISHGINLETAKTTIINFPLILFLQNYLDNIFIIFNKGSYFGLIIAKDNHKITYLSPKIEMPSPENYIPQESQKHLFDLHDNDSYLVKTFVTFFKRADAQLVYGITKKDTFEESLRKTRNIESQKNYQSINTLENHFMVK